MPSTPTKLRLTGALTTAVLIAVAASRIIGAGTGQSFTFLASGFTQDLIGVSANLEGDENSILGGVAFTSDADPMVAECMFQGTRIHRFDLQSTVAVHGSNISPEVVIPSQGGCGMVNHPDGSVYVAMNDGVNGIANIARDTAALIGFMGPPANALGIAVDPVNNHIVYAAEDCRFSGTCTFIDLDPTDGSHSVFATLDGADAEFVDGMYFDPSGEYLFVSNRSPEFRLTILNRAGCLGQSSDPCLVQHVPMNSEPDGVAFQAASPKFVVTNNIDGTMSRFDFPGDDYSQPPSQSVFASGGFRGDLLQVGADGCIYLTQKGVRYDDLTESQPTDMDNSVVRICGGFAPPPGVGEESTEDAGRIGDFVWHDMDHDGLQGVSELGIAGVTVTLSDGINPIASTTTDLNGFYEFTLLPAGSYVVTVTPPAGYLPTTALAGDPALDSEGLSGSVTLAADAENTSIDFGFVLSGRIGDFVWHDLNHNGVQDSGEPGIAGVTLALSGPVSGTTTTDVNGQYGFADLPPGAYTVTVTTPAGYAPTTPGIGSEDVDSDGPAALVSIGSGADDMTADFGFVLGAISGFAYHDQNRNGMRDSGEPGIGGVIISIAGANPGTTTTAPDGSYAFYGLSAGSHMVSAPTSAAGLTLGTPSPLTVALAAGELRPNVNFGYQSLAYRTQTQGGWGSTPHGGNPGALLAANFSSVYPAGVTIGGIKTLKFTSASAIEAFLPAGGKAAALTASAVNPTKSSAGVFAGQVLALRLSVDMSNAGVITAGLKDLYIAPGQTMAGYTVEQVLAMANAALGGDSSGLPAGVTLSKLNDVVSKINENYVDGTQDLGFLVP